MNIHLAAGGLCGNQAGRQAGSPSRGALWIVHHTLQSTAPPEISHLILNSISESPTPCRCYNLIVAADPLSHDVPKLAWHMAKAVLASSRGS